VYQIDVKALQSVEYAGITLAGDIELRLRLAGSSETARFPVGHPASHDRLGLCRVPAASHKCRSLTKLERHSDTAPPVVGTIRKTRRTANNTNAFLV
jgi:hypothetical protein